MSRGGRLVTRRLGRRAAAAAAGLLASATASAEAPEPVVFAFEPTPPPVVGDAHPPVVIRVAGGARPHGCACDMPDVSCSQGPAGLHLAWSVPSRASWPSTEGVTGTCTIDGVERPVVVQFRGSRSAYPAWMKGTEIVVPAPRGLPLATSIPLSASDRLTIRADALVDGVTVSCGSGDRRVSVAFRGEPEGPVDGETCAVLDGAPIRFRTLAYEATLPVLPPASPMPVDAGSARTPQASEDPRPPIVTAARPRPGPSPKALRGWGIATVSIGGALTALSLGFTIAHEASEGGDCPGCWYAITVWPASTLAAAHTLVGVPLLCVAADREGRRATVSFAAVPQLDGAGVSVRAAW